MFTDEDHEYFKSTSRFATDLLEVVAAYDRLIELLEPLSPDGWLLHAPEIMVVAKALKSRADRLDVLVELRDVCDEDGNELDANDPATAEAILVQLGGGAILESPDGRFWWHPPITVELAARQQRLQELEAAAGLLVVGDRYTVVTSPS